MNNIENQIKSKFSRQSEDLSFDDVLIDISKSEVKSRFNNDECNPYVENYVSLNSLTIKRTLPIVSSPMDSIPTEDLILKIKDKIYLTFTCKFLPYEEQLEHIKLGQGSVGAVFGIDTPLEGPKSIMEMIEAGAKHILLDVANGFNTNVLNKLISLQHLRRGENPIKIWAGNVANAEGYSFICAYCDYCRVGVGSGTICSTRLQTGFGRGLLTSLMESRIVYDNALRRNLNPALIVSDGGIRNNGDIAKAIVAGAHLIMMGRQFAAVKESRSEILLIEGQEYKNYRGMASKEVNLEAGKKRFSTEGVSGIIPCTGSVDDLLNEIETNLRSSLSYAGAKNLDELTSKGKFVRVSRGVVSESQTHIRSK